ncbi:MAG: hypothetical protein ABRQ26_03995 [Syntrophomonadaceae bacterium]
MGGLKRALQLHRLNIIYAAAHWSFKDSLALFFDLALGIGMFIGMLHWLAGLAPQALAVWFGRTVCGLFLMYYLLTLASASKTWFANANAFYFTTAPLPFNEMYLYNLLDAAYVSVKRLAGYLMLPTLAALGLMMMGWWGIILALLGLGAVAFTAVNGGFLAMFVMLGRKSHPVWWAVAAALGFIAAGAFYIFNIKSFNLFVIAIAVAGLLAFTGSFFYGNRFFRKCMDNAEISFDFDFTSPRASRWILGKGALPRVLRAYLYKELVTDWRNVFFYARYTLVFILLVAYIPLSHWRVLEGAGLAGALIYCLWVVLGNFHETFASTYTKEGSMITYLLPWSQSKWVGVAKLLTAVVEEVPFVLAAFFVIFWRWSPGVEEAFCLAVSLGLLLTGHLALVMLTAALYTNLENREGGLFAGMLYEYVFAGINPGLLSWYMATMILPGLFTGVLLGWPAVKPGIAPWSHIWAFDGLILAFILLAVYLQNLLYQRRLGQLLA